MKRYKRYGVTWEEMEICDLNVRSGSPEDLLEKASWEAFQINPILEGYFDNYEDAVEMFERCRRHTDYDTMTAAFPFYTVTYVALTLDEIDEQEDYIEGEIIKEAVGDGDDGAER